MMIKTLDNVYINMEDFSGFTIGYPNDFDFTVMAMKVKKLLVSLKKQVNSSVMRLNPTRIFAKHMSG